MAWNSVVPVGNKSVQFNRPLIQANFTYTEQTMGNASFPGQDHYWNVGAPLDGRHRRVSMKNNGALMTPPAGMDGVIYVNSNGLTPDKTLKYNNTTLDWTLNIWENVIEGSFSSPGDSSEFTISTQVPANAFGQILIFLKDDPWLAMNGYFYSDGTKVHGFSGIIDFSGSSLTPKSPIELETNPATVSALRAHVPSNSIYNDYRGQTYQYLLFYRAAF